MTTRQPGREVVSGYIALWLVSTLALILAIIGAAYDKPGTQVACYVLSAAVIAYVPVWCLRRRALRTRPRVIPKALPAENPALHGQREVPPVQLPLAGTGGHFTKDACMPSDVALGPRRTVPRKGR